MRNVSVRNMYCFVVVCIEIISTPKPEKGISVDICHTDYTAKSFVTYFVSGVLLV